MVFTIYSVSADLTLLNEIYNGVAMICTSQQNMIWVLALLASFWRMAQTSGQAVLTGTASAAGVIGRGITGSFTPLLLATLITAPAFLCTVQLESTVNGKLSKVDNVPIVFVVAPAAASLLSQEAGQVLETAFGNTNAEYPSIAATGNGFINPLKLLLTSRSMVSRLSGIDSMINSVVTSCVNQGAGFDYAQVNNMVLNAGNSGAKNAQVVASSLTGSPTAIGALLYQASQSSAYVPNLVVNGQPAQILSCKDAADYVMASIDNALLSTEFSRVVQGPTSGMDAPNPGYAPKFNDLATQWQATRQILGNILAGGTDQAFAETINLLFSEVVKDNLGCLQADGGSKATCMASMLQENEIERTNLENAANANQMLKYAGQFGNMLLALIIGLGPILVIFMFFAGVNFGKNALILVHLMVWPMLVMNIGAIVVNDIIYMSVSNFMASLTQNGFLSQAIAQQAYKTLAIQVGTASNLMASLPVLLSTMFALGGSAAVVNIASDMSGKGGRSTADQLQPSVTNSVPLMRQGSMGEITHTPFGSSVGFNGQMATVDSSMTFASIASNRRSGLQYTDSMQQSIQEGQSMVSEFSSSHGASNRYTDNWSSGSRQAYTDAFSRDSRADSSMSTSNAYDTSQTNSNRSTLGGNAGVNAGVGVGAGTGVGASVGGSAGTGTSADDSRTAAQRSSETSNYHNASSVSHGLQNALDYAKSHGGSKEEIASIQDAQRKVASYQETLQSINSWTNSKSAEFGETDSLVGAAHKIGANEFSTQYALNSDFKMYQLTKGVQFDSVSGADKYMQNVRSEMGNTTTDLVGSYGAKEAMVRHRAATNMAADQSLPVDTRLAAMSYLVGEGESMQRIKNMAIKPQDTSVPGSTLSSPQNRTGVSSGVTMRQQPRAVGSNDPGGVAAPANFQSGVSSNVNTAGASLNEKLNKERTVSDDSGLGRSGNGTAARTTMNVWGNTLGDDKTK